MKIRIGTRYTIVFLALISSVVAVLSGVLIWHSASLFNLVEKTGRSHVLRIVEQQALAKGADLASLAASSLINPMYRSDMREIVNIATAARAQEGVGYLLIFDARGRIIHDGTASVETYGRILDDPDFMRMVESKTQVQGRWEGMLHLTVPVKIGSKILGGVRLGVPLSGIAVEIDNLNRVIAATTDQGMRDQFVLTLSIAGFLLAAGFALSLAVSKNLTRPIKMASSTFQMELTRFPSGAAMR